MFEFEIEDEAIVKLKVFKINIQFEIEDEEGIVKF